MANITQQEIVIKPKKPFDPAATLIRHWFKIAVFGGIIFMLLSPFTLLLKKPYYEVNGKLVVLPETESMISRTDEGSVASYYHQFINTQIDVIKSPKILEKAIEKLPPEIKKIFMPQDLPLSLAAKLLRLRLKVNQPRGTHFIDITLSSDNSEGLIEMLNTVMEVYIDEYQKDEEGKDNRRVSFLMSEKENLITEIEKQTEQLKNISEEIASSVFSGKNDYAAQFQAAYEKVYQDRVEKENKLKATIKEAEALKKLSLDAYIGEMIEKNKIISQLEILAQESLHKLRNSQFGLSDDNPGKEQLEQRIKDIKEYTDEQKNIIKQNIRELLYEKRETELQEKIIHAETELNAAKMIENEILKQRDQSLSQRAVISTKYLTQSQITSSLEQMKNHLIRIDNRLYELKLESKAPGKIRLERMADNPGMTSSSNFKKLIILIFIFAFGSVTGACTLFDILDDRIRTEKDIISSLGTQPHRAIDDYLQVGMKQTPFARVLLDEPTNKVAQSIHSLAIKLDKERKNHHAKIAAFTGVDSNSGVTEILLNTAYAMSKLCSKVLVIEINYANPSLKKLTRINNAEKGLFDYIEGNITPSDCITHDRERGIDLLFAGHLPTDEELVNLDRSKITTLLDSMKEKYDFILVDTMPMLISDLAEFLIVQADIVPLVIQGDRSLYKFTHMAGQTLFNLEVPAIVAVMNLGAPKYNTKFQDTVTRSLLPIQGRIKNTFLKTMHPVPEEPYPLFRMSWYSVNSIGTSFKQKLKSILKKFNHRIIINAFKSIFILFIFIQFTLLLSFMTSTANNVDKYNENRVGRKIVTQPKNPANSKVGGSTPMELPDNIIDAELEPVKSLATPINNVSEKTVKELAIPSKNIFGNIVKEEKEQESYEDITIKNENWILKQDPGLYTIQIMSSRNKEATLHYAKTHGVENNVAYFYENHKGAGWYSLIYGLYTGWSKAMADLKQFPEELNLSSPFIRSVKSIQQDIIDTN